MIFWGPPGVGKTTLAKIIAETTKASFIEFSAVMSGIKEIKQVMVSAAKLRRCTREPYSSWMRSIACLANRNKMHFFPMWNAGPFG